MSLMDVDSYDKDIEFQSSEHHSYSHTSQRVQAKAPAFAIRSLRSLLLLRQSRAKALRSDIAAESRAKIVYEYLMQFTDDPYVKETLGFLMTREIAHFKMFEAALDTVQPNFPPGVMQGDPRYTHTYMNMSNGTSVRGPWNQGQGSWEQGENWEYVEKPHEHVVQTQGLVHEPVKGTMRTPEEAEAISRKLGQQRSQEIKSAIGGLSNQWSTYPQTTATSPTKVEDKAK